MSVDNRKAESKSKKSRPLGVWLLTIFALFFGGIFPLYFEPFDLLRGYTAFYSSKDIPIIKAIAVLNMVIILASILTWKGSKIGKIFFLIFITIFFVRDGIASFSWGRRVPELRDIQSWFRYITDFGFPILCVWYFNNPQPKSFFRRIENEVIDQ